MTSAELQERGPVWEFLRRVDDEEVQLQDHRGGALERYSDDMTLAQIGALIKRLVADLKQIPGNYHPDVMERRRRHNRAIVFLKEILARRREAERGAVRLASAKSTGKESCTCGQRHPYGANFYVSVVDQNRTGLLDGPYRTHTEALANVARVKDLAIKTDSKAHWYAFGTVAMPLSHRKPGLFNR